MPIATLSVYFFLQAAVILFACRLLGQIAKRIGQPQVVGEMIAGVTLGPSLLGWAYPDLQAALFPPQTLDTLYVLAQFGVGLYMFLIGTQFRSDHLNSRLGGAFSVSIAGIAVPFALAFAIVPWLVGVPDLFADSVQVFDASLFLGAAIAITAFPMLARIIHERGLANSPLGTLALTAGAVDDAAAWCILAVVLARFGGSWESAWWAISGGVAYAVFMMLVGRRLLRQMVDKARPDAPLSDTMLAVLLILFCLSAWSMDAIGVHAVFGGFLLGACMPKGVLVEKLREMMQPFVVVFFLPMFFTFSGVKTELGMVLEPQLLPAAIVILVASFAGKGIACYVAARLAGESSRDAKAIGALMNARGLMELILINIGLQAGVIKQGLFSILVLMALVTTLMATPLFNWIMRRDEGKATAIDKS
ncbi:cation:proton antiporter [Pseudoxanthomonas japonensis]|uniref:cation:proton antiporter n=1 Tax=Pseudoxanthomonas japonensis TaxID=69284 RepID=UPI001BCCDA0A|nr:cation:proton antiporter [Pseudoxanthomonas japonensis]